MKLLAVVMFFSLKGSYCLRFQWFDYVFVSCVIVCVRASENIFIDE